jgi:hypothetical protein
MIGSESDWERWGERWRAERASGEELDAMIERTARSRRAILLVRVLSFGVAAVALGIVFAALRHAGNKVEVALGLIVSVGIIAAWFLDATNQRRAGERVEVRPFEYLEVRRVLCLSQLRFVRLGRIVAALDLVFLFPWWVGGIRVHGFGFHLSQLGLWGPLTLIIAFVAWTVRVRSRALAELEALSSLTRESGQG